MLFKCYSRRVASLLLAGVLMMLSAGMVLASEKLIDGSRAKGEKSCVVADTDDMRRNHMEYMKHDRDLTVRNGDRSVVNSISGCVNCHAGKDSAGQALPVNGHDAQGNPQFCAGCHEYVGVSITCFQCHRKVPEEKKP